MAAAGVDWPGWLRLRQPTVPHRSYMLYSTMMPPWWRRVRAWGLGRRSASDPGILALGTLAPGPGGHEPILSPERLARDLDLALEVASNPPATVPHDAAFCTVLPRCHAPAEQR